MFGRTTEILFSTNDVWNNFPSILWISMFLILGVAAWSVINKFLIWILLPSERSFAVIMEEQLQHAKRWVKQKNAERWFEPYVFILLTILFVFGLVFIFVLALASFGLNALQMSATIVAVPIFLNYLCIHPFPLIGAAFALMLEWRSNLQIGRYITWPGKVNCDGRILHKGFFSVWLQHRNAENQGELVRIPISWFLSEPYVVNTKLDLTEPLVVLNAIPPTARKLTGIKIQEDSEFLQ